MKKRLTVLISGRGSNLESLIRHAESYQVTSIVTNSLDAPGIAFGSEFNIPVEIRDRKDFSSLTDCKDAIFKAVQKTAPDFVALAGFMQILQPKFVEHYFGRLLNIHPSLLPLYPGLDTHQRALEDQQKEHGCTVHFVDSGMDTGPIIAQSSVEVLNDETVASLQQKVLTKEHLIYPWAMNLVASGDIQINERNVTYSKKALESAKEMNFKIKLGEQNGN
ncbi:MAG: phosphoribosylglycinamide formyltransferase [Deltaproteobacteria bacterium]|nr:phosphoribosylglycinamide formyltransferase [Deltaproteobacteria bacterium]